VIFKFTMASDHATNSATGLIGYVKGLYGCLELFEGLFLMLMNTVCFPAIFHEHLLDV